MCFLNFHCYFTIDSSVGRYLCFDDHRTATNTAGQKTISVTKCDITVTESDTSDNIVFMSPCYRPNKGTSMR